MRGARTEDLRAELNRRRAGEDARISVERARERRLNIEGRNLNADLDAMAPKPPGNARIQAGTPVAGVGCTGVFELFSGMQVNTNFYDGTHVKDSKKKRFWWKFVKNNIIPLSQTAQPKSDVHLVNK